MKNKKFPTGTSMIFLHLLVLAAGLSGCIESAPVPDEVKSSAPGFGSSERHPEGTPLSFPAGIKVVGNPHWDAHCTGKLVYGVGAVRFCIQFSNTTDQSAMVTIPAGTVFVAQNTTSPNGLIVKEIKIILPASRTQVLHFMTCSINQDRTASAAAFDTQPLLTNHYSLPELLNLLESKKINAEEYEGQNPPAAIAATVQKAVYEIAHTGKLDAGSRAKLAQLPGK